MIFVSVGTQLPFDRLIRSIISWVSDSGYSDEVIAQAASTQECTQCIEIRQFVSEKEYKELFERADIIIAHSGMGSILNALFMNKPIVIMPRRSDLREHRNDHQLDTTKRFLGMSGVFVAWDETELHAILDDFFDMGTGRGRVSFAHSSSPPLPVESELGSRLKIEIEQILSKAN